MGEEKASSGWSAKQGPNSLIAARPTREVRLCGCRLHMELNKSGLNRIELVQFRYDAIEPTCLNAFSSVHKFIDSSKPNVWVYVLLSDYIIENILKFITVLI